MVILVVYRKDFSVIIGIAGEGKTDLVTIRAILKGLYKSEGEPDFLLLQPHQGASEKALEGFGGWTSLLNYISSKRFRDDVVNSDIIVIQVDTDVSEEDGFDVPKLDAGNGNIQFTVEQLVKKVVDRLVSKIDEGLADFYQDNQEKIVFAVSVHSLECWIFSHYQKQGKKGKTLSCENALSNEITRYYSKELPKYEKTTTIYEKLVKPFLKIATIKSVKKIDKSFKLFIQQFDKIEFIEEEDW